MPTLNTRASTSGSIQHKIYLDILKREYNTARSKIQKNPGINLEATFSEVLGSNLSMADLIGISSKQRKTIRKSGIFIQDISTPISSKVLNTTPLIHAIMSDNEAFTLYLLDEKRVACDTNHPIGTPLYVAIGQRAFNITNNLLRRDNIDLNRPTPEKSTYLHLALGLKDYETARMLIEKGVDPNRPDVNGIVPMLACCVNSIDIPAIKFLVQQGASLDFEIAGHSISILSVILFMNDIHNKAKVIESLIKLGANLNPGKVKPVYMLLLRDDNHSTEKNITLLETLVKNNANIQHITDQANCDFNLLHSAAAFGKKDFVAYLLNNKLIDPNNKGFFKKPTHRGETIIANWTPLHAAAAAGRNIFITKTLLDEGANPVNIDSTGRTPLHWAAYSDDSYTRTIFSALEAETKQANSTLQLSRRQNDKGVKNIQLNATSSEIDFKFYIESEGPRAVIVNILLNADQAKTALYHADQVGDLPLHKAVYNIAHQKKLATNAVKIVERLLEADSNNSTVHHTNREGNTPLYVLAYSLQNKETLHTPIKNIITQLIQAGAGLDIKGENKTQTPFEIMPQFVKDWITEESLIRETTRLSM